MSHRPYADDWALLAWNPDISFSLTLDLYWSAKEQKGRDSRSAEWAGWVGQGAELKNTIRRSNEPTGSD